MSEKLPWKCPHCGAGKRYPMALCGQCMRFSNHGLPAKRQDGESYLDYCKRKHRPLTSIDAIAGIERLPVKPLEEIL